MNDGVLDGEMIRRLLGEVADALGPTGDVHTIIVVGGSLLAFHGLRESTADVDSIRPIDAELRSAASTVAERHGIAVDWLNHHAGAFASVTIDTDRCDGLMSHGRLRVLGAPLREVFLMKLRRSSPQDLDDMRSLWPSVASDFPTARDIVRSFHEAFPLEEEDEHLAAFVVAEVGKGGFDLSIG